MKKQALVSVVIPTYGRSAFLQRAINSVIAQTYPNIEIIVVDDNNPDSDERKATETVMSGYAENTSVIYLQHEKNKNGSAARNTGLSVAKGKYISFLDDDDEMRPNRIELLYKKMESLDNSWSCCYSGFTKMKPNGIVESSGETRSGNLYIEALKRSLFFCPGSNLFSRTEKIREINGFDEDFFRNQDLEFMVRVLENGKIAYIPNDTLIIHYEEKSIQKKTQYQKKLQYQKLIEIDTFFLNKFKNKIDKLSVNEQKKIYQYFALERFRYSVRCREIQDGLNNCRKNKVTLWLFFRYLVYMGYRVITKKSVGFNI